MNKNNSRQLTAALAAFALACSLAACASATSGAEGSGLCSQIAQVTRLVVKRANLIRRDHEHFTSPPQVTVSDPAKARSVAEAACALPPMPSGAVACPADFGLIYRLTFSADSAELSPVTVEASGCSVVRGLGQARTAARSPGFWRVLRKAEGK
jgi:hypothetical protein